MKRPFRNIRPFGPFGQSSRFRRQLLTEEEVELEESDQIVLIFETGDIRQTRVADPLDEALQDMVDFVVVNRIGIGDIRTPQDLNSRVAALLVITDMRDEDVTLNQIEQFIERRTVDQVREIGNVRAGKLL